MFVYIFCVFTYNHSVTVTIVGVYIFSICARIQGIDELKESLSDIGVQYIEETLVIGKGNRVYGLSKDTFVSLRQNKV